MTLKSIKKEHDYSSDDDDLNSENIAFVARKFRKFMFKEKKTMVKIKKIKILPK
jgi:hypothetical protein